MIEDDTCAIGIQPSTTTNMKHNFAVADRKIIDTSTLGETVGRKVMATLYHAGHAHQDKCG